jgi:hypothetical protein
MQLKKLLKIIMKTTEKVIDELEISQTEMFPQHDGGLKPEINDPNYCKIYKNSGEIESAEDFSYHMMNDHDPKEVLAMFGQNWIETGRRCIRRESPFEKWLFFPPKNI